MKYKFYKRLRTLVFTGSLVCISVYAMTSASGPVAENTGAPGETTCGQSSCHNFNPITNGAIWNNITMTTNIPASGYVPSTTYTITIGHTQAGHNTFGFQATMLDANSIMSGDFAAGSGTARQTSNGKIYINHTAGGTSGSGSKSWTFSWTSPSIGMGALTMYVAVNAANGDAALTGDTIFTKAFVLYQAGQAPPTATISADKTTICQYDTVHFTGGGANSPTSFNWSFPGGSPVLGTTTTSQNPIVVFGNPFAAGSITRSVSLMTSNANGNSQLATQGILEYAAPNTTTTPTGNNVSICGNDSVLANATSGANYTFLWSPGNQTTQSIYLKNTGTYSVKVTNTSTGCAKVSAPITATKRTLPTVTLATSTDSICKGDSVVFTASAGLNSYEFFRDATSVQNSAAATFKGAPASSALQYTVYGTDGNGCKSLASNAKAIQVQIPLAAPVVSCDSVSVSSIRFAWAAVSGADGYEVSLDSGKNWVTPSSGATGLTHFVSGLNGATKANITVRAIQSSGKCSKGDKGETTCQTTGCAAVTYTLTYDSITCNPAVNDSVTVIISNVNTPKYSTKVDVVNASGVFISSVYPYSAGNSFKVKLNGTTRIYYRFTVLDSVQLLCPAGTSVISVRGVVSPAANPTLTFGKSVNVLCDREQATFTFSKPAGTTHFHVMKNNNILEVTTQTTVTYPSSTFANNDVVKLYAIDSNTGCSRVSGSITLERKSDPKAGFTYDADTLSVQFTDTTSGAAAWIWTFGEGSSTSSSQNPQHSYLDEGTYDVKLHVVTADECKSDTALHQVTVSNVGLAVVEGLGTVSYYPNPVKSELILDINTVKANQNVTFEVRDLQGRSVHADYSLVSANGNKATYRIDLSGLSKALYLVVLKSAGSEKAITIIKE